jgi:hypothetical protein
MWGMRDRWLEYCQGLNGWSVVEVWYLGLDHVDKDCGPWLSWEAIAPMESYPCSRVEGLLTQKISTIIYLLYVVYVVNSFNVIKFVCIYIYIHCIYA